MVAQVILVHFVEVRILTGLPFFCLEKSLTVSKEHAGKRVFRMLFFLTGLLRHGMCHAVRIFYGGCLALLALRAVLLRLAIASNPYGDAIFFALKNS